MSMTVINRKVGVLAASAAVALGLSLLGAGNAWAIATRSYTYDCGTSRAPVLNVTIFDDQPGEWQVSDTGAGGPIPQNVPNHITLPNNTYRVEILVKGTAPGYIDEQTGVVCDTSP